MFSLLLHTVRSRNYPGQEQPLDYVGTLLIAFCKAKIPTVWTISFLILSMQGYICGVNYSYSKGVTSLWCKDKNSKVP